VKFFNMGRLLPFKLLFAALCIGILSPAVSSSVDSSFFAAVAPESIISEIRSLHNWTCTHRRALHQIPELLFELHETSAYVQSVLTSLSIPFKLCARGVGIIADIGSGSAPCVALRADMDALPISESADVEFKSQRPGKSRATPPCTAHAVCFLVFHVLSFVSTT
jgi:hypothetical protein